MNIKKDECIVNVFYKKYPNLTPFQRAMVSLLVQHGQTNISEEDIYKAEHAVRKNMEKGQGMFSAFFDYVG